MHYTISPPQPKVTRFCVSVTVKSGVLGGDLMGSEGACLSLSGNITSHLIQSPFPERHLASMRALL